VSSTAGFQIASIAPEDSLNGTTLRIGGDPAPYLLNDRLGLLWPYYTAFLQLKIHTRRSSLSTATEVIRIPRDLNGPQAVGVSAAGFLIPTRWVLCNLFMTGPAYSDALHPMIGR